MSFVMRQFVMRQVPPSPEAARFQGLAVMLYAVGILVYLYLKERDRKRWVAKLHSDLELYYFMLKQGYDLPHLRRDVDLALKGEDRA